jgi:threonylcarbamoyladenosine tRNA methylthiotransferase MtaB
MPTAAFTTLGCKVNQYETQKILESFEDAGFQIVAFGERADVYVINSCSVTSSAESKSRYTVRRAARNNPDAKVLVTGCAVQMSLNKQAAMEGAHTLVPNTEKLDALSYFLRDNPGFESELSKSAGVPATKPPGRTRATLKVQDGCSVMCSYCSIPYTRPKMVSRPWQEVLAEAQKLSDQGYREAVLTGVLIGAYGPETGSEGLSFEQLVERLSRESGLSRLRISSIEMHQVTDPILQLVADGFVVPHFHIPLQSGDTQVLKDMNRRYDQEMYLNLVRRLYQGFREMSITTDIMVGFPTETDERFESSVHVCEQSRYLKAHVFRFSPRWGTPADQWGDPVPPEVKQARSQRLMQLTKETGRQHVRQFLGRTMRVLVEGKKRGTELLEGNTDNWITTRFAGSRNLAGTMQWVRLEDERDGVAYGEMVQAGSESELPMRP